MSRQVAVSLPCSVWIPSYEGELPSCFSGIPLDIIRDMALTFSEESLSYEDSVAYILEDLQAMLDHPLELPASLTLAQQAAVLVGVLLEAGLVKELPKA